jgi:predicted dehydrogenase
MPDKIKIAILGLDTSHVEAFAKLLHNPDDPYHVPGGRIVAAFPGGSPDFALSRDRVDGFTAKLRDQFGVTIFDSPEKAAEGADAILLESVDGRIHRAQFESIAHLGKPVFIDKPFAVSSADAAAIAGLAREARVPLMSCSSLRFAEGLQVALADQSNGDLIGADFFGPMAIEPTQPGFFWYGIHAAEMLLATLGGGVASIQVASNADHDFLTAVWNDGRIGTIRGNRKGNGRFGGVIHREKASSFIDVYAHPKPYYASLLEVILPFFQTGVSPVPIEETLEIVGLLESANRLREKAPHRSQGKIST